MSVEVLGVRGTSTALRDCLGSVYLFWALLAVAARAFTSRGAALGTLLDGCRTSRSIAGRTASSTNSGLKSSEPVPLRTLQVQAAEHTSG